MNPESFNRVIKAYLVKKAAEQEAIIDTAKVFSKRYGKAVDELEEIEELLELMKKV